MSSIAYTKDKSIEILKTYNDYLHSATNDYKYVFIVEQDLADPRMFTVVKDGLYENGKLEGARLIFSDPEQYKEKFPEFFALPPVHIPTNTRRNEITGRIEGIKKDPIDILSITKREADKWVIELSELSEVGCLWLWSFLADGDLSIYTSIEGTRFESIDHLKDVSPVIRDSEGKPLEKFIPFNFDPDPDNPTKTITAKYILIVFTSGSIAYTPEIKVRVTRAFGI